MVKNCVWLFRMALMALGISAISLFAIALVENQTAIQYTLAGIFWLSLITELALLGVGNSLRKKIERSRPHMKRERGLGKIGLFCFAQNREAVINDILLLISIAYLVTVSLLRVDSVWLILVGLMTTYVFFQLHCILNGILYKSIKYYQIVIHKRRERK